LQCQSPVAKNARGIAVLDDESDDVLKERTLILESFVNSLSAGNKGYALGAAVLTSIGLILAFIWLSTGNT